MNSIAAQEEILALLGSCFGKVLPLAERVVYFPAICGLSPNMSIVHPYLIYSILFHTSLFLIKKLFPSLDYNIFIFRYDGFD